MLRFPVEFRRAVPWVLSAMAVMVMLLPSRIAAAQTMTLPAGYVAQVLQREWRAAFPYRPAFGSLCALAPLTCALIDRPFAFNAHLELIIRPNAPDGSTGVLLPFAVSVPLFGRAEVGLGSCYAGHWAGKETADTANGNASALRPAGLCPFWLAAKLLLFPWFRDPHGHPALAAEYLFEQQAGPFGGLNQLGLPGTLSKVSLAYRHPLGRFELSAAASVLVDHTSGAGTLQLGGHIGYRLPVGEHFFIFGQVLARAPSWGPMIASEPSGTSLNLAPPTASTVAVGVQQRADFGFGAGLTLMLTRSDLDTRVDLMFRLLSFEVGPHIKPLIPAREKTEVTPKITANVKPPLEPASLCPPGMQLAPAPPDGSASSAPRCIPMAPPVRIPSPLWGHPCYLAPLDGSPHLRMGNIDATGQYCEWDGLRLPLGAVISPPRRGLPSETRDARLPTQTDPTKGLTTAQNRLLLANPTPHQSVAIPRRSIPAARYAEKPSPPPTEARIPSPKQPQHVDRVEQTTERPPAMPASAFASGFIDRAKETYRHTRDIYRTIKDHGVGVVIPSEAEAEAWLRGVHEQCLERLDQCLKEKAKEAAQALNDFRRKPWEEKKCVAGEWAFDTLVSTAAGAVLPGAGIAAGGALKAGERALAKGGMNAVVKKAGKEAAEEIAERTGEAAARRVAAEAEERLLREATERGEREVQARAAQQLQERTGRGKNHLAPHQEAAGPHTTFRRDQRGNVSNYVEWEPNPRNPVTGFDETKRVDFVGEAHKNKKTGEYVPTPHVHDKTAPGGIRAARADELPTHLGNHQ